MKGLQKYWKWLVPVGILCVVWLTPLGSYLSKEGLLELLEKVREQPFAVLWYILVYIMGVVFFIPATPMMVMAAPLFGFWKGLLAVVVASNLGCQLTFWLARFLGRDAVGGFVRDGSFLEKANGQMAQRGLFFLLLIRMIPIFPFSVVNYLSGLTSVSWQDYALGTFFGMLPGAVVTVFAAYAAGDVGEHPWLLAAAAAMVVVLGLVIWWLYRKKYAPLKENPPPAS